MFHSVSPKEVLLHYFNYQSFRGNQEEIINSILTGNDTLAILPTGGGKSICYQIPAIIMEGTAIVFSPLISLMKDQVDALISRKIPATYINSSLDDYTQKQRIISLINNEYKLIYVAPERLKNIQFQEALSKILISFIAIDEAHCISQWGHDFRPSYRLINDIFKFIPQKTIAGFTATANSEVQNDIVKILRMQNPKVFVNGFRRDNISIFTEYAENKNDRILELISANKDNSIIIYAGTRTQTEEISNFLQKNHFQSLAYHGGMSSEQRKEVQEKFLNSEVQVIVATNAFGMGIDKPNIRVVIHTYLPTNIEGYYQEIGRAGRDGKESRAYFIYTKKDEYLPSYFIASTYPNQDDIQKFFSSSISYLNTQKKYVLNGDLISLSNIYNIESKKLNSIIRLCERNNLLKYFEKDTIFQIELMEQSKKVLQIISNLQGIKNILYLKLWEIRDEKQKMEFAVSLHSLSAILDLESTVIKNELDALMSFSLIQIKQISNLTGIHFSRHLQSINLDEIITQSEARKQEQIAKSNQVIELLKTSECKSNFILNYFGEFSEHKCGKCSSCLNIEDDNLKTSSIQLKNITIKTSEKPEDIALYKKIDALFTKTGTFLEFAQNLKLPPADAAYISQKAIESGWAINHPKFISTELLSSVSKIINRHPAMRLSQIRSRIESEITLPELRIAVSYAKKLGKRPN
jgi:ATP-dependent DNA helicase RecQ